MNQPHVFLPPAACAGAAAGLSVRRVQDERCECLPFAEAVMQLPADWTLVLPVEAVTACAVRLPTLKARWLRQALPFAVEELLAEDVEQLHLALGEPLADGRHRVFAVRRGWLAGWLALCPSPPLRIVMDADLLPQDGTSLLQLESRWLLGGAGVARLALDAASWPALAEHCPSPHVGYRIAGQALPAPLDSVQSVVEGHVWLARQTVGSNLAQAEFAARPAAEPWLRWRPLVGLLGLWLVLQWGFNLAQGWHLQRQAGTYALASEALYRQLFPEDHKLVDLRAQLDQHLVEGGGGGQGRLLGLLDQLGRAMAAQPDELSVRQLDFSDSRGDLALQVQAPGFSELERLRRRLEDAGLAVQLGSASREESGVSARLVIGG